VARPSKDEFPSGKETLPREFGFQCRYALVSAIGTSMGVARPGDLRDCSGGVESPYSPKRYCPSNRGNRVRMDVRTTREQ
jgi:hypothetical protein